MTSLWRNTPIHRERQVFFGQNTEPMMASEVAQYLTYFASMLPDFVLRRYINPVYRSRTATSSPLTASLC